MAAKLSAGCNSFHREVALYILKRPLAASSAEEWNVQELRVSGIPCRDGGSSGTSLDVRYSGAHLVMRLKCRTAKRKYVLPSKFVFIYRSPSATCKTHRLFDRNSPLQHKHS